MVAAGCATPTTETSVPPEAAAIARSIPHIRPSADDTCETQRQVAAQSSRIDTLIQGRDVVYKPRPCPAAKPPDKVAGRTS